MEISRKGFLSKQGSPVSNKSDTRANRKTQMVNINGKKFQMTEETWVKIKKDVPRHHQTELHNIGPEVYAERHPAAFESVLYYQQGGELHLPSDMCPSTFKRELEFWGVEETNLSKCCFVKYTGFFDDLAVLMILEDDEEEKKKEKLQLMSMTRRRGWRSVQAKAWLILNEPFYNTGAKIYFVLSAILILLSLFALMAGTHPVFQRSLHVEEWQEYFGDEWEKYKHFFIGQPEAETQPEVEPEVTTEPEATGEPETTAEPEATGEPETTAEPEATGEPETTAEPEATGEPESTAEPEATGEPETTAEPEATGEPETTAEPEATSEPESTSEPEGEVVGEVEGEPPLPENAYARFIWIDIIEYISTALFTIDLLVRYLFCPYRIKLLKSFLHWVDVLAVAVMYAKYIFEDAYPKEKYEASVLDILHCMQVVRVFRLFRLVKNTTGFRVLVYAFKASFKEMALMTMFLMVAMMIFSTLVYFSGDSTFTNIPDSFWWAIVTMTTVGYGDVVPKTALSKTIGVVCAVAGVCLLAVIIPIFVNNFMLFYNYTKIWGKLDERKENDKVQITKVVAVDDLQTNPPAKFKYTM